MKEDGWIDKSGCLTRAEKKRIVKHFKDLKPDYIDTTNTTLKAMLSLNVDFDLRKDELPIEDIDAAALRRIERYVKNRNCDTNEEDELSDQYIFGIVGLSTAHPDGLEHFANEQGTKFHECEL